MIENIFESMFENVGKKIKGAAKVLFVVGIIISIGVAIINFANSSNTIGKTSDWLVVYGILYLVFGPIASWMVSVAFYGFGELIEKVAGIEKSARNDK